LDRLPLEEAGTAVPGETVTEEDKTAVGDAAAPATPARRRRRRGTSRSTSTPPHKVLRLTTYERLGEYLSAFAKGRATAF
jgi:hypothetical protein